ncbi:hypothetical protein F4860DRAFT_345295 [Xylaria cubensis]|nr:hypothetical protein F4860DRAFT_345295 [Xylaria cubensis]
MSYVSTFDTESLLDLYNDDELCKLLQANDEELNEQQRSLRTNIRSSLEGQWWKKQHQWMRITREYYDMCARMMSEGEFKTYALQAIFCRQRIAHPFTADGKLVPVRLLEPDCKPKHLWETPPLQGEEPEKTYLWNIHPDCSFAFSLQAFGPNSSFVNVQRHVVIFSALAICAYLSIEFKKPTTQTTRTIIHQLIVASTIALYNRYLLKSKVREGKKWSVADYKQLRHYGIMFEESIWTLFCTVPKTPLGDKLWCTETNSTPKPCEELPALSWTGCEMLKIASGDCQHELGTKSLLSHLLSVHLWGLYTHAESCRKDIIELDNLPVPEDEAPLDERMQELELTEGGKNGG